MKRSSDSHGIEDKPLPGLELNLPEGDRFRALPPQVSLDHMLKRCRELRQWFPEGIRTAEERWAARTTDQFQL
ncbi:MAG TPA: hypothetical protein GYA07_00740 [Verrucomicrobia bacterium]|nr:hypothetical protein [Verrucomicrobiota bacterium]HOP96708.1 hypothetical protein [Verrucomicrobiota bacterium]